MNLKIGNIENFNNKILVSKSGFKLGKNEEINQPIIVKAFEGPRKPLPSQVVEEKIEPTTTSSAEEHEEEKTALIIFGTSAILLGYYFFK